MDQSIRMKRKCVNRCSVSIDDLAPTPTHLVFPRRHRHGVVPLQPPQQIDGRPPHLLFRWVVGVGWVGGWVGGESGYG